MVNAAQIAEYLDLNMKFLVITFITILMDSFGMLNV